MKKYLIFIVVFIVIAVVGITYFKSGKNNVEVGEEIFIGIDPLNSAYVFDGKKIILTNGKSEREIAPDSASKLITTVFGEPIYGDLDNDNDEDAGLILAQSGGGSGTFYYAAVAEKTSDGFLGTEAILLGDRIAPQTIEIKNLGRLQFCSL